MAVSKSTRFEVLRRDSHTCRYCGAKAPDVVLHVDHVTPTALGGSDKPDNLVAACMDCNAGKGSTSPDAETVADVAEFDVKWRRAMEMAASQANELTEEESHVIEGFDLHWVEWHDQRGAAIPRSANWQETVLNYWRAGLPVMEIIDAISVAMNNKNLDLNAIYPYFCGVARNKVKTLSEVAAGLIERGEV